MVQKLFVLPLLPAPRMQGAFEAIRDEAAEAGADQNIMSLLRYVEDTWFSHHIWRPVDFCAYQRLVRTNNDQEGYHRRLNNRCRAGEGTPLYKLLETVHDEARLVDFTCKLVGMQAPSMRRRQATKKKQAALDRLWEEYALALCGEDDRAVDQDFLIKASKFASF